MFDALLAGLDRDWVFTDRWVLEPPVRQEGLQVFGRVAHEPGGAGLVVDVEVEAVPDGGVPIDPRRHGVPIVLHDPDRLIRVEQEPDERLADEARTSARRIADRSPTARWIVEKAIARGHWPEAAGYHLRFGVDPLVQLLRTVHCPSRWDFGLRYVHADLPADDVRRVLELLPGDPDGLAERSRAAFDWQDELLSGGAQARAVGSVAVQTARRSSAVTEKAPSTSSAVPPVVPIADDGHAVRRARRLERRPPVVGDRDHRTSGRLGEEGHERVALELTRAPTPCRITDSASTWASPPSETSWAEVTAPSRAASTMQRRQRLLGGEVDRGRQATEVAVHDVRPLAAGQLLAGLAEQQHGLALGHEAGARARGDVVDHAEGRHHRRRQDRGLAGLVVEADVAAGHRDAEHEAGVLEAAAGLGELPHHVGVLGRAEVQAVGDRERPGPGGGHVAERLRERELRAGVRVEPGEAAVAVRRHRDPEPGLLVDPHHARVVGLGEDGVALHVAVVLVGDPGLVAEVRATRAAAGACRAARRRWPGGAGPRRRRPGARPATEGRANGRWYVGPSWATDRGGTSTTRSPCQSIWSRSPSVTSPTTVASTSHLAQIARNASTSSGSTTAIIRSCDSLIRISSGASVESRSGTRSSSTCMPPSPAEASSEVAQDSPAPPRSWMPATRPAAKISSVHSMRSFSWKGSPTCTLGRFGRPGRLERLRGEHAHAADAVAAGLRAVQDHLVADAGRLGQVQVLVAEDADAERVDQRVAEVRRVEDRLAADVRQPEAVAVATHAGHDPGQHAMGVGRVERAEAQRVHHRHRARAHRQDVADDAADAGGRALVGLDVRRVVVRLDLERDRVALADVDHAGVLADAGEGLADRRLLRDLGELLEMHLGGLVGAVLAPHDRVHRQLRAGRPAAQDLADPLVLVGLETEVAPGLLPVRVQRGDGDGVERGAGHGHNLSGRAGDTDGDAG